MSKNEKTSAEEVIKETEEVDCEQASESDNKEAELIEIKAKYDEIYDKYLRTLAEYDNFKKRTQKEKDELYGVAVADTVGKLLPVMDNLERAIQSADEKSPFFEGVEKIVRQFDDILEKMDVKPIEAEGCEFNPNVHNAVMHVEDDTLGSNVVAEELMKGYIYKERVIRYSMVKVAN